MRKPKISYSALDTYNNCGHLYYLKYIRHIKPYIPIRYALVTGVAFHALINKMYHSAQFSKEFLIRNWKPTFFQALEEEGSAFSSTHDSGRYLNYGYGLIHKFFDFAEINGYLIKPIATEWPFTIALEDFNVIGIVDLIIKPSTRTEIIDFKTGWKLPNMKDVEDSKQLTLYDWAVKNKLKIENPTVGLFFPRKSIIIHSVRTETDHNKVLSELSEVNQKIAKKVFEPNLSNCKKCDFHRYCKFFKGADNGTK